jgi:predicted phosphohydrolase
VAYEHRRIASTFTLLLSAAAVGAGSQGGPAAGETFVGAGDIADCRNLDPARATGRLLDTIGGTVFTLGDHAYKRGDAQELRDCYGPAWGRHKDRTHPTVGNHDLLVGHGRAYFDYFGANAGPDRRGYYSYDLGTWHLIALNSETSVKRDSAQIQWLRDDLRRHPADCVLAYWHVPRFSSGSPPLDQTMREVWAVLYDAGVDVVVNGHQHWYERFAPQDVDGHLDTAAGIQQFIVGTGGGALGTLRRPAPNSEVRNDQTFGVLKLTLGGGRYAWEFVPAAGGTFRDAGSAVCRPARSTSP